MEATAAKNEWNPHSRTSCDLVFIRQKRCGKREVMENIVNEAVTGY
jgi:hypothetical protein